MLKLLLVIAGFWVGYNAYDMYGCHQKGGIIVLGIAQFHCIDPSLLVGGTKL